MDDADEPFRYPWQDEPRPAASRSEPEPASLLIPLARAQDAVARLEASVAAAPHDLAAGLRARLALFEAASFLAHRGPAVHPNDLALRDAGLTGSYSLAAMAELQQVFNDITAHPGLVRHFVMASDVPGVFNFHQFGRVLELV